MKEINLAIDKTGLWFIKQKLPYKGICSIRLFDFVEYENKNLSVKSARVEIIIDKKPKGEKK